MKTLTLLLLLFVSPVYAVDEPQTNCDKYPNSIGCSEYGQVPPPEQINENIIDFSINPTYTPSGYCPSPINTSYMGKSLSVDLSVLCQFAEKISPLVVSIAFLVGAFIILSGVND